MELKTIRQVTSDYGITRRMLCYYEEIGLLKSSRKDDYAYRVYEESEIKRLQQIILLRKLQIPMKQIKDILNNQNAVEVIEIFNRNINELDEQITALSAVRSILIRFVQELQEKADVYLKLDLLNDKTILAAINALAFSENKIKEKVSMDELNKASETLSTLDEKKDSDNIGPEETQINTKPLIFNQYESEKFKFQIAEHEPFRFIGKSMYVRAGASDGYCAFALLNQNWIFDVLEGISEHAVDIYDAAFVTWDKYDEKNQLMGYTVGRFFKAETPVPNDMDYFDIPKGCIGKCFGPDDADAQQPLKEEAERQGYRAATWIWHAEVLAGKQTKLNPSPIYGFAFFSAFEKI